MAGILYIYDLSFFFQIFLRLLIVYKLLMKKHHVQNEAKLRHFVSTPIDYLNFDYPNLDNLNRHILSFNYPKSSLIIQTSLK